MAKELNETIRQRCAALLRSCGWRDEDAGFGERVEGVYCALEGRGCAAPGEVQLGAPLAFRAARGDFDAEQPPAKAVSLDLLTLVREVVEAARAFGIDRSPAARPERPTGEDTNLGRLHGAVQRLMTLDLAEPGGGLTALPIDVDAWIERRVRVHFDGDCDGITKEDCIDTIREDLTVLLRRLQQGTCGAAVDVIIDEQKGVIDELRAELEKRTETPEIAEMRREALHAACLAIAGSAVLRAFGDEYEGRLASLRAAVEAYEAESTAEKTDRQRGSPAIPPTQEVPLDIIRGRAIIEAALHWHAREQAGLTTAGALDALEQAIVATPKSIAEPGQFPPGPSLAFISGYNAGRYSVNASEPYGLQDAWATFLKHGGTPSETTASELVQENAERVFRDGFRWAIEAAAKVCEDNAVTHRNPKVYEVGKPSEAFCHAVADGSEFCAARIRRLATSLDETLPRLAAPEKAKG